MKITILYKCVARVLIIFLIFMSIFVMGNILFVIIIPQVSASQSECSICRQYDVILPILDEQISLRLFCCKIILCMHCVCKHCNDCFNI